MTDRLHLSAKHRRMLDEWNQSRWGDLATLEYGKALRAKDMRGGSVPVFGTNGQIGWHDESLWSNPSVILGRKGAYRGVHYSRDPFYVIDTAFYLKPKIDLDARWAYYQLLTQDINSMDSGSAIPSTSREEFYSLPVDVPPTNEQRAIAHVLGTLDDKIELNRRMNETLEAMAQALFKSWFIDFDPVRAKIAGRSTGLPKHVDDLFPECLVDSEIGKIPHGWKAIPLLELMHINPSRSLKKGETAPYLGMVNMPTKGHIPEGVVSRPFGSGTRFTNGDTLVARITPCLENGKTAYVDFLLDGQIGWGSTEYIVMRPKAPLPNEFAYCLARSARFREFAIKNMTGTSGRQRLPVSALHQFLQVAPPKQVAEEFRKLIQLLMAQASAAKRASHFLAELRETLLPKLISGELRVSASNILGATA